MALTKGTVGRRLSNGSVGINMRRSGSTGSFTPATAAASAAHGAAPLTHTRDLPGAPAVATPLLTGPRVVSTPLTPSLSQWTAVTSVERQRAAPCSQARAVNPTITL